MSFLRSLFGSRSNNGHDLEKNNPIRSDTMEEFPELPTVHISIDAKTARKLAEFRIAIGISSTASLTPRGGKALKGRVATNLGLYPRVVRNEKRARRNYHMASKMINTCLGLQIVVAATLTALGAADRGSSSFGGVGTIITVFGAINTVIAGVLTYLKGSGLPNRYKYYENEWARVRELIEQRERDLLSPSCNMSLDDIIDDIDKKYKEVKSDVENSTPDNFISPTKMRRKDEQVEMLKPSEMTRVASTAKALTQQAHSTVANTAQNLVKEIGGKIEEVAEDLETAGKAALDGKMKDFKEDVDNTFNDD